MLELADRVARLTIRPKDGSAEHGASLDAEIQKITAEIEQMAPNMKANERYFHSSAYRAE